METQIPPSGIRVSYAQAVYGEPEIQAVLEVFRNPSKIVAGPRVAAFEESIARLFGKKHGVMVNSGSSANLLAFEVLRFPAGAEVITPALTFATTVSPIIQKGLSPVFVDVLPGTYQIDVSHVEERITPRTKALMIPSLIGNLPDLSGLRSIADAHNLLLIEDSCDTLGAQWDGKPSGYYSHVSTTSFYASHIITAAGGGGMACFHDEVLAQNARVIANWGRQSTLFGAYEKSEDIEKRFAGSIGNIPYDAKFIFSTIGYNLQASETQGAFGLEQLKRLQDFIAIRQKNVKTLLQFFTPYEKFFILPKEDPRAFTTWLAFPLTIREGAPFTRLHVTRHLEEHNIQTRPIFTGNILRQPAFSHLQSKERGASYPHADHIMGHGFLVGCHHGLTEKELDYMKSVFSDFLQHYS